MRYRQSVQLCADLSTLLKFVGACRELPLEPAPLLHQFRCYLETLLGQVKMRAVLANVFPIQFVVEQTDQSATAQDSSRPFNAPIDFRDDNISWDAFAIAV